MNRRSFFTKLGLAAATLAILPSATTYARKWIAPTPSIGRVLWMPNPEWVNAPYEISHLWQSGDIAIYKRWTQEIDCYLRKSNCTFEPGIVRLKGDGNGNLVKVEPFILA